MPNLNFTVSENLLQRLREAKVELHCRNWAELLEKCLEGEGEVDIDFIIVNEQPAKNYDITFKLGDYLYKWEKGKIILLSSGNVQKVLKAMLGARAPTSEAET